MSQFDDLITRAHHLHGKAYADLLRADIAIARRLRDTGSVPQAWQAKRRRLGRALDRERAAFARELERARRRFWRG